MAGFVVRQFRGVAPKLAPRLLADNQAQSCTNARFKSGTLQPIKANEPVMTLPKSGAIQTIHRFGQDVASDSQYWFHWSADVNVVRGFVAGDVQERTYWTGDGSPKVTDSSIALASGTSYPMASYTLGVPFPSTSPICVVGGTPEATALAEDRVYIVTVVSAWGEEGQPSDASNVVSVTIGETVTITLPSAPSGSYSFASKRIYRSVPGSMGTPFLFVAEVPVATTEYVDSKSADNLGEQIASMEYETPPSTMQGLIAGPNGVMAGFIGKDIFFCEPFIPHAWPSGYSQTVDSEIVSLAVFDTTWVVLTKSAPYLISGSHPDNYTMVRADIPQSCISKRSVAPVGGGVVYASPDGLFLIGGSGSRNLTEAYYTRTEWQSIGAEYLSGYVVDNTYIGFIAGAAGFMFDLVTGDMSMLDWNASAGFYDPIRDELFLVTGNNQLVKFNTGSSLSMTWHSKPFYTPRPINLGAARVEALSYPVTLKVYADGALKHTKTVANDNAFRLPCGFLAKAWEFEVTGSSEVSSIAFAQTVQELSGG